jgi:hypothetical protein
MSTGASSPCPLVELDPKKVSDEAMAPLCVPLHVRVISNALKHHEALSEIAREYNGGDGDPQRFSLVVEDDAVFSEEQMIDAIHRATTYAPPDADIIFLGLPSKRQISELSHDRAEFDDVSEFISSQVLPGCDSYLVSRSASKRLSSSFLPIRFSTNVHWTYLIRTGVVRKAYIAVPNAFVDGSKLGIFPSSISTNNQLIWNQGYCKLRQMVDSGKVSSLVGFEKLWNEQTSMLQNHPDSLVLLADYHMRCGRVQDAVKVYGDALDAYEKDGCIVNNTSDFMKRYMDAYEKLQEVP